jgi:hypothetical protein
VNSEIAALKSDSKDAMRRAWPQCLEGRRSTRNLLPFSCERICGAGDTIMLPAGTLHKSEALDGGAIYAIATRPPTEPRSN